jgi:hypothetical protein
MISALRQWLPYLLSRLGPAGGAGLLLLVAALGLELFLVQPQHEANRQLDTQLKMQSRVSRVAAPVAARPDSLQGLEPAAKVPEAVARLFAAAKDAGLLLDKGEYRLVSEKDSDMSQYQIMLPLTGSFPVLRNFLNEVLLQPGLALDSLKFARASVEVGELEAQLRFTLFVRERP